VVARTPVWRRPTLGGAQPPAGSYADGEHDDGEEVNGTRRPVMYEVSNFMERLLTR